MTKSNFEGKTDAQLQELKSSLDSACSYCSTQQDQFWGKGQEEAAGMFAKNSEDFAAKSQEIQDELDRRAKEAANPKKQQQAADEHEEQPVSTLPPDIDPAGQPTPATQPVELSTAQQQEQQKGSSASSKPANKD